MYFDSIAMKFISKMTLLLSVVVMVFVGMKAVTFIQASPELHQIKQILNGKKA